MSDEWDYITLQQVSNHSYDFSTYQPYLDEITAYIKKYCPHSKLVIHETWAYEENSKKLNDTGYKTPVEMFKDVKASYQKAYDAVGADVLIPSGELLQELLSAGIQKVHRDTFHLSFGVGRYAVGLLWYAVLTGNDIQNNTFCDFDEEVSEDEMQIVKRCVTKCCNR